MSFREIMYSVLKQKVEPLRFRMREVMNDYFLEVLKYFDHEFANEIQRLCDYYSDNPYYASQVEQLLDDLKIIGVYLEDMADLYGAYDKVDEVEEILNDLYTDSIVDKLTYIEQDVFDECITHMKYVVVDALGRDLHLALLEVHEIMEKNKEAVEEGDLPADFKNLIDELAFLVYDSDRESLRVLADNLTSRANRVKVYMEKELEPFIE